LRVAADPVDAESHLVDVAPAPVFARLERADDRMLRGLCVRSRVAVRRVIAAADVTASRTDAQMQPSRQLPVLAGQCCDFALASDDDSIPLRIHTC